MRKTLQLFSTAIAIVCLSWAANAQEGGKEFKVPCGPKDQVHEAMQKNGFTVRHRAPDVAGGLISVYIRENGKWVMMYNMPGKPIMCYLNEGDSWQYRPKTSSEGQDS